VLCVRDGSYRGPTGSWGSVGEHVTGRPSSVGMSFELDSFLGRPYDQPGCASSTDPSVSCARRLRRVSLFCD
jgi:hypothetical protein